VIYAAEMEFKHSGGTVGNSSEVPSTETVTLKADTTVLQTGDSKVLVDGQSEKELASGNELKVQTSNHLSTD
jgi:hypothetical protein